MQKNKNELTYEQALMELESLVAQLQNQAISVDDLEQKSKRANELVQFCKDKLRSVSESLDDTFELNS